MRSYRLEQFWSDPGHPIEARQGAKRTALVAVGDDARGQRRTDPGEPRQLGGVGAIEVDPLTGCQGSSQALGTLGHVGARGRVRGPTDRQLNVARGSWPRCEDESRPDAKSGEHAEQKGGAGVFAGHDPFSR